MAQKHLEQKIEDSQLKARNRDEDRPAVGAPSKGKALGKGKANAKNKCERRRLHTVGHEWPTFVLEIRAHSSMNPTRKAQGMDDFVHLLRQVRTHRNSKGDGKGSDNQAQMEMKTSR